VSQFPACDRFDIHVSDEQGYAVVRMSELDAALPPGSAFRLSFDENFGIQTGIVCEDGELALFAGDVERVILGLPVLD
jgi:hypothetical protein